ncbi:DUF4159 domain-containing protein [Candidatus Poribacteria bacterium]|nr:DUF4159 domain-containing protein [Candidatus Poribacteria bacterium]
MSAKRTSGAFITSLIIHVVAIVIVALYFFIPPPPQIPGLYGADEVSQVSGRPRSHPIIHPLIKPTFSTTSTLVVKEGQLQPRITTAAVVRTTSLKPQTVIEFSHKVVKFNFPIQPNLPKSGIHYDPPLPQLMKLAELPPSDEPNVMAVSTPVVSPPAVAPASMDRGIGGSVAQLRADFLRPAGLSMLENVGVARDALGSVVENMTLGNAEVPPLPRGEPGGRIICIDRDIRGVFRFTRIRHSLSDWWADASALNALTKWLNERTRIKTDMNVEGGAIKLTDANLMKSPLVFMTGHDPALVQSRKLMGRQYGGGVLDNRLSEREASALRKYLIEEGGLLVFDDCGVNAPAQAMIRLFQAQMRYVMPEYQIERISNNHEIYNNYYAMGGPPVGFDIFWWGTKPPKRNYLEGISVGDKLSVLIIRRDYMCAMESVSLPTRSVHYSPGVYRFMTNVVVYALTHGSIADYSGYVPRDRLAEQELPTRAPQAARIGAVGPD